MALQYSQPTPTTAMIRMAPNTNTSQRTRLRPTSLARSATVKASSPPSLSPLSPSSSAEFAACSAPARICSTETCTVREISATRACWASSGAAVSSSEGCSSVGPGSAGVGSSAPSTGQAGGVSGGWEFFGWEARSRSCSDCFAAARRASSLRSSSAESVVFSAAGVLSAVSAAADAPASAGASGLGSGCFSGLGPACCPFLFCPADAPLARPLREDFPRLRRRRALLVPPDFFWFCPGCAPLDASAGLPEAFPLSAGCAVDAALSAPCCAVFSCFSSLILCHPETCLSMPGSVPVYMFSLYCSPLLPERIFSGLTDLLPMRTS